MCIITEGRSFSRLRLRSETGTPGQDKTNRLKHGAIIESILFKSGPSLLKFSASPIFTLVLYGLFYLVQTHSEISEYQPQLLDQIRDGIQVNDFIIKTHSHPYRSWFSFPLTPTANAEAAHTSFFISL